MPQPPSAQMNASGVPPGYHASVNGSKLPPSPFRPPVVHRPNIAVSSELLVARWFSPHGFQTGGDNFEYRVIWLLVYCCALLISASATALVVLGMLHRDRVQLMRSSLKFVIWVFLLATSIHGWVGLIFYFALLMQIKYVVENKPWAMRDIKVPPPSSQPPSAPLNYTALLDALQAITGSDSSGSAADGIVEIMKQDQVHDGPEASFISKLIHTRSNFHSNLLLVTLLLENITIVLGSYWLMMTTRELFHLALTTIDRGAKKELRTIKYYTGFACLLAVLLLGTAMFITSLPHRGLDKSYRFLVIVEFSIGLIVIIHAACALLYLKRKKRTLEFINGKLVMSPLYRRLKSLLTVCTVFSLPYCSFQLFLLMISAKYVDRIPDLVMGVCTTLFYLFGTAQAIIMGTSQECCFRCLAPLMPTHIRESPEFFHLRGSSIQRTLRFYQGENAVKPPAKDKVIFVNTDIEDSSALWASADEEVMKSAQTLHDDLLRKLLIDHHGYEITTCGDSFQLAFHHIKDAVAYCLAVQLELLLVKWPDGLEGVIPSCATQKDRKLGIPTGPLFKGLRVRMGIHDASPEEGQLVTDTHPVTGKTIYMGASEMIARDVSNVGFGGQIIVSERIAQWLENNSDQVATSFLLRKHEAHSRQSLGMIVDLFELVPKLLGARVKSFDRRHQELLQDRQKLDDERSSSKRKKRGLLNRMRRNHCTKTSIADDSSKKRPLEVEADEDDEDQVGGQEITVLASVTSSDEFDLFLSPVSPKRRSRLVRVTCMGTGIGSESMV